MKENQHVRSYNPCNDLSLLLHKIHTNIRHVLQASPSGTGTHTHLPAHSRQTPAPDARHLSVKEAPRTSLQLWTCRSQMHLGSQRKTVCDFPHPVKRMTWWESWCGNQTGPAGSWDAGQVPLAAWLLAVAACWPGTWARRWCLPIPAQQLQWGNQNYVIMKGHWTSILPSK